jgi:hypothetical protein
VGQASVIQAAGRDGGQSAVVAIRAWRAAYPSLHWPSG